MKKIKKELLLLAIGVSILFTGCENKSQASNDSGTGSKETQTQTETKVSENGEIVKVIKASDGSITEISTISDGSTVEKTAKSDGTIETKTIDNTGSVIGVSTQVATEVSMQALTEVSMQAPTEVSMQAPTQVPTEAPTQTPTEAPMQEPTEAPFQAPTEAPTEAPTQVSEEYNNIYVLTSAETFLKQVCWSAAGMGTSQNVYDQLCIIGDDFSNGIYSEEQCAQEIKKIKDFTQPEWWIFKYYAKIIVTDGKIDCSNMQSKQSMIYLLSNNVELRGDNKYTRVFYNPTTDKTLIYYTTVSGTIEHN